MGRHSSLLVNKIQFILIKQSLPWTPEFWRGTEPNRITEPNRMTVTPKLHLFVFVYFSGLRIKPPRGRLSCPRRKQFASLITQAVLTAFSLGSRCRDSFVLAFKRRVNQLRKAFHFARVSNALGSRGTLALSLVFLSLVAGDTSQRRVLGGWGQT